MKLFILIASFLFVSTFSTSFAATYFWIGGTGNWSDPAHWSLSSGGPSAGAIPTAADNVSFDAASSLTGASTITMNVPVTVVNFNFSLAPNFTLSGALTSIEVRGNLIGNSTATITYSGAIHMFSSSPASQLTSGGRTWANNFVFTASAGTNGVILTDALTTTGSISVTTGIFNSNSKTINCATFSSTNGGDRVLTLSNSIVNLSGTSWSVSPSGGGNTLVFNAIGSTINVNNATTVNFSGGGLTYNTLNSQALVLQILGSNVFGIATLNPSSTLKLENNTLHTFSSLVLNGTCSDKADLTPINLNQQAATLLVSTSPFSSTNLNVNKVNAQGPTLYNLSKSMITNATGWSIQNGAYYWIGNSGNWTDGNHWSTSSGGPAANCIPTPTDTVYFDANSFSLNNQIVLVNDLAYFKAMKWIGITESPVLALDTNMMAYGDVQFHNNMSVNRNVNQAGIQYNEAANLSPNGASIDCNFRIQMPNNTDALNIQNALIMSDTSSILLLTGAINSLNNPIVTGTFQTLNDPNSNAETRTLTLGSSQVQLKIAFLSEFDNDFSLNAGTSHVYIGDTVIYIPDTIGYKNDLKTNNLTFYDVTLNFQGVVLEQTVSGNNTFNKLRIIPGSKINFTSGSNQTVNDSLLIIGTCADSIRLYSFDPGQFTFTKSGTKVKVQCVKLADCIISSAQNAYFSTSAGNNGANWTFNAGNPISASFTTTSPDCFGTTTTFTPTVTTLFGEPVTYSWLFNDGSSTSFASSQFVANKNNVVLNFPQPAGLQDTSLVSPVFTNWTEVSDPQGLFFPIPGNAYKYTNAEFLTLNFNVNFNMKLNNPLPTEAYLVDMNNSFYDVKYKYKPRLLVYRNGTLYSTINLLNSPFIKNEGSIPSGLSLIGDTTVTVSVTTGALEPTDVLSFRTDVAVYYESFTAQPRWKDADTTIGNDVAVSYQLGINSINLTGTPNSSYISGTNTHQFLEQGQFDVVLIATNTTNQCTDTILDSVYIFAPITYFSTSEADTTICVGDSVFFDAGSNTIGALFQYFVNGVSQGAPSIDSTFSTNTLSTGDIVYATSTAGGCTSLNNTSFQFQVNPLPVFTLNTNPSSTICAGTPVSFTANANPLDSILYKFQKNGTFLSNYNLNGTYSNPSLVQGDQIALFGKNSFGCVDTQFVTMTVLPLPTVTLTENSGDFILCAGESVTFTAGGASTYEFFINGISQGPPGAAIFNTSALTNGNTISVKGYSAAGCTSTSPTTFTYSVNALPNVSMNISPGLSVCSGNPVTISASGASTYQFFLNGTAVGPVSVLSSISSSSYANNSTFYVVGSVGGCSFTTPTQTLTVLASPTTTLTSSDPDNSICAGTPLTFTATGATTYQFFVNGIAQTPNGASPTFSSSTLSNGNIVSVTGFSNGCNVSQQATITVLINPNVLLFSSDPNNTVCVSENITFTGANATQYQLFVNGTAVGAPQPTASFVNPALITGTNSIYVVGTAANGCSNQSATNTTLVNPLPSVSLTSSDPNNTICAGQNVTFTGTGASQYQFSINGSPQGVLSGASTFTTSSLSNGQTVTVTGSSLGCLNTSIGITTIVNPLPSTNLLCSIPSNSFCQGAPVTFTSGGATTYEFFVNGISQGPASLTNTLNASGFVPGNYPVTVTGTSNGCSSSASISALISPTPSATLISSDPDNTICSGQSVTYTGATGSTFQFSINGVTSGATSPLSSFTTSTLTNGAVVSVQVFNSQGCSATAAMPAITVNPVPTTTLSSSDPNQQICVGENVVFTANGATNYEFFINGISQGTPSPTNTFSTSTLLNGQSVSVAGTSLGCSVTTTPLPFTVFGPPAVQLFNNGTTTICAGDNLNLSASGAANYQFTINGIATGPFSPVSTFSGTVNNNDVITVTGQSNGCNNPSATNFTFTVLNYPVLSASSSDPDLIICQGDAVTINATGASNYTFNLNGLGVQNGPISQYVTTFLENGDILTVTGYNGACLSVPSTFTYVVNALDLSLNANPGTLICSGDPIVFTSSGADLYEFFVNGNSQGIPSANNSFTLATPSNGDAVSVEGTSNSTGCVQGLGTSLYVDAVDAPLVTSNGGPDFCEGDSIILTGTGSGDFQWSLNGSPIVGATDSVLTVFESGNYSLSSVTGGNGEMWSFGLNAQGIFANDVNLNSLVPVEAVGGQPFDAISSGDGFMLGLTPGGTVFAWGENSSGQLGNGTFTSSNNPLSVSTLSNIKCVATTSNSAYAVDQSGNVYIWGNNSVGQLATGNTSIINFPFQSTVLTNVDTIAAGKSHIVILKNDGTVWTAGSNVFGQRGTGNLNTSLSATQVIGLTNVVRIGASENSSYALLANGDLMVWGKNTSGQLGLGDINNRLIPTINNLKHVKHVEGGANHTVFLTNNDLVYAAGDNQYGQLGNGSNTPSFLPVLCSVDGVTQISASEYNTLFLRIDHSVYGCGSNIENQVSPLSSASQVTPTYIENVHGVTYIEMAKSSSHYLYGISTGCVSNSVNLNMLSVPVATISESNGILSTIQGDSYQWYLNGAPLVEGNNQTYVPLVDGYYSVEVNFSTGCSSVAEDYPFGEVGIDEINGKLSVYPNPAQGIFFIDFTGASDIELTVVDPIGRVIIPSTTLQASNKNSVDLSHFGSGTYLFLFRNRGEYLTTHSVVNMLGNR
jgi:alpha-tubulin suppressor-like RCC1 family protein